MDYTQFKKILEQMKTEGAENKRLAEVLEYLSRRIAIAQEDAAGAMAQAGGSLI